MSPELSGKHLNLMVGHWLCYVIVLMLVHFSIGFSNAVRLRRQVGSYTAPFTRRPFAAAESQCRRTKALAGIAQSGSYSGGLPKARQFCKDVLIALVPGFQLAQLPQETDEDVRFRHVHQVETWPEVGYSLS